jgi:hypothetical protein
MKFLLILLPLVANATEIKPVDHLGQIQYNKNSLRIVDNKIVEVTPTGKVEYHKQQYIIKDSKVLPVSSTGQVQYHKQGAANVLKRN